MCCESKTEIHDTYKDMKANELRIGNWINTNSGDKQCIDILCDSVNVDDGEALPYEWIDPIPLTGERLKAFGARKISETEFVHDRYRLIWKPQYKYWYVTHYHSQLYLNKVGFVHEWQNFVFVMDGVELTLQTKTF